MGRTGRTAGLMRTVAVVGGGASGLAAAVSAAERARSNGAKVNVVVYEASDRVGRPILASGNGRCNFSNANIDASVYWNADFVREVLDNFERCVGEGCSLAEGVDGNFTGESSSGSYSCIGNSSRIDSKATNDRAIYSRATNDRATDGRTVDSGIADDRAIEHEYDGPSEIVDRLLCCFPNGVVQFFSEHGLVWREESEGRLYPQANKASVVLDVLRSSAAALGVEERVGAEVCCIEPPRSEGKPFTLRMKNGEFQRADVVIAACGGKVAQGMLPDVLDYTEPVPVLGPIATNTEYVRQLDNIRVKGALELHRGNTLVSREVGEIMFRKYGVSGIAAFNLSRLMQVGDTLRVDFLPNVPAEDMVATLAQRADMLSCMHGKHIVDKGEKQSDDPSVFTYADLLRGMLLPQVSHVLLASMGLDERDTYREAQIPQLAKTLKGFALEVRGIGDAKQCQVHRGGFSVDGFDNNSLESYSIPGLFVTGEALDVDAPCGGYNLHWAFATGILAGKRAADALAGNI